jgi:hypothetical protein
MIRRIFITGLAAALVATPAAARRGGSRGDRGSRGSRGTRPTRPTRGQRPRITVLGLWAIGIILILDDTGEECVVVGHAGDNSICELLP